MKRFVSVLLFVLMVLSLTGCMSVRMPMTMQARLEPDSKVAATQPPEGAGDDASEEVPEEEPEAEVEADPEEVPQEPAEGDPAEAPQDAPEVQVPFEEAIATASEQLADVQSLHMDMRLNTAMAMTLLAFQMDLIEDPFLAFADISSSVMGERTAMQMYATVEGEAAVLYVSRDEGITWEKEANIPLERLPQSPAATIDLFLDLNEADMEQTGTAEVDGVPVVVYSGEVDGERLKDILYSTGIISTLGSAMGSEVPEESLLDLGEAPLTFMFDAENGLPVRFSVDMTEVVTNLIEAFLGQSLGGEEGTDLHMQIPAMILEVTLSQFDSVEAIEIPEAALNAPAI